MEKMIFSLSFFSPPGRTRLNRRFNRAAHPRDNFSVFQRIECTQVAMKGKGDERRDEVRWNLSKLYFPVKRGSFDCTDRSNEKKKRRRTIFIFLHR